MNAPKFLSSGDSAITVEFGNEISAEIIRIITSKSLNWSKNI